MTRSLQHAKVDHSIFTPLAGIRPCMQLNVLIFSDDHTEPDRLGHD